MLCADAARLCGEGRGVKLYRMCILMTPWRCFPLCRIFNSGSYECQLQNQQGKTITFAPQDREALVQALMLNEQGRLYLQKVSDVKASG